MLSSMRSKKASEEVTFDQGPEGDEGEHLGGNWRNSGSGIGHSTFKGFKACCV